MESPTVAASTTVFIIRVWTERGAGGDSQRGYVQHVPSGSRRYFGEIGEVADFIAVLSKAQTEAGPFRAPLE